MYATCGVVLAAIVGGMRDAEQSPRDAAAGSIRRINLENRSSTAFGPRASTATTASAVRQLTNAGGTVTDTYEYDAFGNQITHTGTTSNDMLYRGEQWDSDLGFGLTR